MATAPISYGNEYGTDAAAIERSRKYAELMQQQSMLPEQQQTAGGWVIPTSGLSVLAKGLQGLGAGYMTRRADEKEKEIANRYQKDLARVLMEGGKAQTGTPAMPANNDVMQSAQSLDSFDGNPAKAAVPGDPSAAANIYMQHPATQQLGMQMMQQNAQRGQWAALLGGAGGAPGAPSGGAGGILAASGITPQEAQAALLADPTGKLLAEKMLAARAEKQKPILQREGDVLRQNPDGSMTSVFSSPKMEAGMMANRGPNGQVTGAAPIPGYAEGMTRQKSMEAGGVSGAQAQNKLITVNTPQGPRMMTEAQAAQMAGGQAPQAPWVGREPRGAFEGDPALIAQQIDAIKDPMEKAAATRAFNNQMGGNQAAAPRGAGIPLQSDSAKAYESERAKDFAKQASGFADSGAKATGMMRQLGELETLYKDPNVTKGAIAENISGLKNLAASFGVDIKGVGGEQAISAITNKMALDMRSTAEGGGMPGAMSDADRNFLANMTPNLSKTPQGRAQIIANMRKMAQRQNDIARMATAYEKKNGQIDIGFQKEMQDFANANPLFTSPAGADNIDALLEKYK